jgi:PD-(D/E)XK nuclease superfamily
MTTKFSVSDANLYKLCPRRMFYEKVEGYGPSVEPNHLKLGKAYDSLLEAWDKKGLFGAQLDIPQLFEDEHEAAEAEILLALYDEACKEDKLPPIENQGSQHGFGIDIGELRLTGYLDKLAYKEMSGVPQHIVVERKTTSEPIEENSAYWNKLDLDPQIRSYVLYLRKSGMRGGWVCYEVIRKLSSVVWSKLANKKQIPIDQYRSLLQSMPKGKTLVARKWFYVSDDMTQEFENEHQTVFAQFNGAWKMTSQAYKDGHTLEEVKTVWPKHEQSCNSYGGCPFKAICKNQTTLANVQFTQKEGRFSCSI